MENRAQQMRDVRDCPKCGAPKGDACRSPSCVQLHPAPPAPAAAPETDDLEAAIRKLAALGNVQINLQSDGKYFTSFIPKGHTVWWWAASDNLAWTINDLRRQAGTYFPELAKC